MAINFKNSIETGTITSSLNLEIPAPAYIVQNDLLIAAISTNLGQSSGIVGPTGWISIIQSADTNNTGNNNRLAIFYKIATITDEIATSYTFSWSDNSSGAAGGIAVYENVSISDPIGNFDITTGTSANPISPNINTSKDNALVIRIYGSDAGAGGLLPSPESDTYPIYTNGRFAFESDNDTAIDTIVALADEIQPTVGPVGTATFTMNSSNTWVAASIEIQNLSVSSSSSQSSSSSSSSASSSSSSKSSSSSQSSSSSSSSSTSSSSSSNSSSSSSSSSGLFIPVPKQIPRIKNRLNTTEINLRVAPGKTQTNWNDPDGVIDDFTVHPIRAIFPGEITYIGTPLDIIVGQINDANYSFSTHVMGTKNLKLHIRVRRRDENNFIALKIDFSSNLIMITEVVNGVETILDQNERTFEFRGIHTYQFEIWMIGRFLYGFVNNYNVIKASTKNHRKEPGFSLYFPTIDDDDPPAIIDFAVSQTLEQSEQLLPNDLSNLYLQFRLQIKEEIENPTEFTWETYQKALKLYEQRNVGAPDAVWESLGYPIRKPSPEQWFGHPK